MKLSLLRRPAVMAAGSLSLLLASACSYTKGNEDEPAKPCVDTTMTISYSRDIVPIMQNNCYKCHGKDVYKALGQNHNWQDYEELKLYAQIGSLVAVVEQKDPNYKSVYMPRNAAKLSACDIERIKSWVAAGAPNN